MKIIETRIPGVLIVAPKRHVDTRGFFVETFQLERLAAVGIPASFVQDSLSRWRRGVLRAGCGKLFISSGIDLE